MAAKYPHVKVNPAVLALADVRMILAEVAAVMERNGVPASGREAFLQEAWTCQSRKEVRQLIERTVICR